MPVTILRDIVVKRKDGSHYFLGADILVGVRDQKKKKKSVNNRISESDSFYKESGRKCIVCLFFFETFNNEGK